MPYAGRDLLSGQWISIFWPASQAYLQKIRHLTYSQGNFKLLAEMRTGKRAEPTDVVAALFI